MFDFYFKQNQNVLLKQTSKQTPPNQANQTLEAPPKTPSPKPKHTKRNPFKEENRSKLDFLS